MYILSSLPSPSTYSRALAVINPSRARKSSASSCMEPVRSLASFAAAYAPIQSELSSSSIAHTIAPHLGGAPVGGRCNPRSARWPSPAHDSVRVRAMSGNSRTRHIGSFRKRAVANSKEPRQSENERPTIGRRQRNRRRPACGHHLPSSPAVHGDWGLRRPGNWVRSATGWSSQPRTRSACTEAAKSLKEHGYDVHPKVLDMGSARSITSFGEWAKSLGPIDVLVNAAGILPEYRKQGDHPWSG